jgi:THO complex subunit 3
VQIYRFPELEMIYEVQAHTSNIYCIDFDPRGRYFALGGADALASVWDIENLSCVRTFGKLEYFVQIFNY